MSNPFTVGQHLRVVNSHPIGGTPPETLGKPGQEVIVTRIVGPKHIDIVADDDASQAARSAHTEWFEAIEPTVELPEIGSPITTAEQFNTLPIGATLTDKDGWVHTKIADNVLDANQRPTNATTSYTVDGKEEGEFYACWHWSARLTSLPESEVSDEETVPERPTINFAGSSRQTSRDYASNILKITGFKTVEHAGVLEDVANGYVVDAYALNAALTAALRAGLNKGRTAADRRDFGTQVAHLGHITQAVLENHADSLPAYVEGQRSRKVEALQAEVDRLTERVDHAMGKHNEVSEELAGVRQEAADYRASADGEAIRLLGLLETRADQLTERQEVVAALSEVTKYALGLLGTLNELAAAQVLGFMDAHDVEFTD